jgi:hypothetical protein
MEAIKLEEIDRQLLIMENKFIQELIKGGEKPILKAIRKKIDDLKNTRDTLLAALKS